MNEDDRKERKRHPLLKHKPAGYEDLRRLSKGIMEKDDDETKREKVDRYLKGLIRQELDALKKGECNCSDMDEDEAFELLDENTQQLVVGGKINIPSLLRWCSKINMSSKGKFD